MYAGTNTREVAFKEIILDWILNKYRHGHQHYKHKSYGCKLLIVWNTDTDDPQNAAL